MEKINFNPGAARALAAELLKAKGASAPAGASQAGFGTALADALKQVSAQQMHSSKLAQEFQLGNPAVSLEEAMIASQKASVSFQVAAAVRNRVIAAYNEIMSMNV